jgi:hypothetical protein
MLPESIHVLEVDLLDATLTLLVRGFLENRVGRHGRGGEQRCGQDGLHLAQDQDMSANTEV